MSVDIYSLSVILFELFSGIDPFPGDIFQIVTAKNKPTKNTPKISKKFPKILKGVILRGWSKNPLERPGVENFQTALTLMIREEEDEENSTSGHNSAILSEEQSGNEENDSILKSEGIQQK